MNKHISVNKKSALNYFFFEVCKFIIETLIEISSCKNNSLLNDILEICESKHSMNFFEKNL